MASKHSQGFTLEGIVELDETYVNGGRREKRNRNPGKRGLRKRGRGTWNDYKTLVVTMVKRGNNQE